MLLTEFTMLVIISCVVATALSWEESKADMSPTSRLKSITFRFCKDFGKDFGYSDEHTITDPAEVNSKTFRRKRELGSTCPANTQKLRDVPKMKVECLNPGEYATCAPCPIGYYKNKKAARKVCAQCGCGTGTPKEGATKCIKLCEAGEKLQNDSLTAKRICLKCEKGTYQPFASLETTCIPCPTNWTTVKEGRTNSSDCFLNCSAGTQPNDAKTDCVLCPEGQYKAKAGPHPCNICPKNKTTLEDGALMKNECIVRCVFGTQINNTTGTCEACGEGTFKPENSSRIRCRPCPEGLIPNRKTGATKCIVPPCPICGPSGEVTQDDSHDQTTTACPVPACPACPDCKDCPTCPAVKPCPTCSPCPDILCPTTASTTQYPEVKCPTTTPCPEVTTTTTTTCPDVTCPEPAICPACPACPTPTPCPEVTCPSCPTTPDQTPCPDIVCPTCPTTPNPTPCPKIGCPTCPTTPEPTPCPEVTCPACPTTPETTPCPQVTCPTSTPCPEVTCPTTTPCPTCPQCPTTTPCPVITCPSSSQCPEITCPTITCPTCPTTTECPEVTCPSPTSCPPKECPKQTECPSCPTCPTPTQCPVITCPAPEEPPASSPTEITEKTTNGIPCISDLTLTYNGKVSVTRSGNTCQKWADQYPHEHRFTEDSMYPDGSVSGAVNYCRDPDGEGMPWCYTIQPGTRYEYCDIPICNRDCWYEGKSRLYHGTRSTSKSGRTCQHWSAQSPHQHSNDVTNRFPVDMGVSAAQNFCRDPDLEGAPWCYTTDPNVRWEFCEIEFC